MASALGLPNLLKLFQLGSMKGKELELEVLTQTLGGHPMPIAYLSVKLDHTVQGWPTSLRAVVATCKHLQEAEKFLLHKLLHFVPPQVLSLLEQ